MTPAATSAALPRPGHPRSFRRFLARAERRRRRAGGSGSVYPLAVLTCFYAPAVIAGSAYQLASPAPAQAWLALVPALLLLAAALAAVSAGWSALGPIPASPAWVDWVLSTPLDRGVMLARRVWARQVAALLPGVVLGALAAMGAGLRGGDAVALVLVGAAGGVVAYATAILRQRRVRARLWRPGALAAVAFSAAALAQTWFPATALGPEGTLATIPSAACWAAAGAVALAAVTTTVAASSVRRIPQDRLAAAYGTARGVALAFTELSLEPVGPPQRHARRASAPSRPLTGTGQTALASLGWRRLRRDRIGLARFAVTAVVFYPLALIGRGAAHTPSVLAVAGVIAASLAVSGVAGTARAFQRRPHLPAHLGLDARASRRTARVIPAVMALGWAVLVTPAMLLAGSVSAGPLAAALGYAVVAHRLSLPEFTPTYAVGLHHPVDLGLRFARGPAQLVLACGIAAVAAAVF